MAETKTLVIERVFDAPVEKVWRAWSEPEAMKKWWGPKGYSAPVSEIDFREGGTSFSCMQSPEGEKYWGIGVYKVIIPMKKIVVTDEFADEHGNPVPPSHYKMGGNELLGAVITVTFEDMGGKTKMTLTHEGIPAGDMAEGATGGWNESFDKLAENLKS